MEASGLLPKKLVVKSDFPLDAVIGLTKNQASIMYHNYMVKYHGEVMNLDDISEKEIHDLITKAIHYLREEEDKVKENPKEDSTTAVISQTQPDEINDDDSDANMDAISIDSNQFVLRELTELSELTIRAMRRKRCTKFIKAAFKDRNMKCDLKKLAAETLTELRTVVRECKDYYLGNLEDSESENEKVPPTTIANTGDPIQINDDDDLSMSATSYKSSGSQSNSDMEMSIEDSDKSIGTEQDTSEEYHNDVHNEYADNNAMQIKFILSVSKISKLTPHTGPCHRTFRYIFDIWFCKIHLRKNHW